METQSESVTRNSETAWERKYKKEFLSFLIETVNEYNPDFIVPVARKACKLIDACDTDISEIAPHVLAKVRYKNFFKFNSIETITNKKLSEIKIAILDDVSESTKSLLNYRLSFCELGFNNQNIYTYAFKGNYSLFKKKDDEKTVIGKYLTDSEYSDYLFQQTKHFLLKCVGTDIDHLVLKHENFSPESLVSLKDKLSDFGYLYDLPSIGHIYKFSLQCNLIKEYNKVAEDIGLELRMPRAFIIKKDFVEKIRFVYNENTKVLLCIPLVFPKMDINIIYNKEKAKEKFKGITENLFFEIQKRDNNKEPYYNSISLVLNSLLFKYVFQRIGNETSQLSDFLESVTVVDRDFKKIYPKSHDMVTGIKSFLTDNISVDEYFEYKDCVHPFPQFSHFDFSKSAATEILTRLRSRYKQRINEPKAKSNRGRVKYSETIEQIYDANYSEPEFSSEVSITSQDETTLKNFRNINPLTLTELIDELCDLTILVPTHRIFIEGKDKGTFVRTYRSGEVSEEFNYQRSKHIFHTALYQAAIKNKKKDFKVRRMLLEKLLANFQYDFYRIPRTLTNHDEIKNSILNFIFNNHVFGSEPSYWGPQAHAKIPFKETSAKLDQLPFTGIETLDKYGVPIFYNLEEKYYMGIKEGYYLYEGKEKSFQLPSTSSEKLNLYVQQERKGYLNEPSFFYYYFDFLIHIDENLETQLIYDEIAGSEMRAKKSRRSAIAQTSNAFIICRDFNWFCKHVFHNIDEWKKNLLQFENLIDLKDLPRWFTAQDGRTLESTKQKLEAGINARTLYESAERLANEVAYLPTYGWVWNEVIKHNFSIDEFQNKFLEVRTDFERLLNAMYSLSNLVKQKFSGTKSDSLDDVKKYTSVIDEQLKLVNIDFKTLIHNQQNISIEEFLSNEFDETKIKNTLLEIYQLICVKISELKTKCKFNDSSEEYDLVRTKNMLRKYKNVVKHCFSAQEIPFRIEIVNYLEKVVSVNQKYNSELELSEEWMNQVLNSNIVKAADENHESKYIIELPNKRKLSIQIGKKEKGKLSGDFIKDIKLLPRIFVCFAREENSNHNERVDLFVEKLNNEFYFEAINDTRIKSKYNAFEWGEMTEKHILEADKVIFVLSKSLKEKVDRVPSELFDNNDETGIGWEWGVRERDLRNASGGESYYVKQSRKYFYAYFDSIKNEKALFDIAPSEFLKEPRGGNMDINKEIFMDNIINPDFIEKLLSS